MRICDNWERNEVGGLTMNRIICATIVMIAIAPYTLAGDNKLPLLFEDDFANGADRWQPSDARAWKIVKTDKGHYYSQFKHIETKTPHRSPRNFSFVKD